MKAESQDLFDVEGMVVAITGAGGVLMGTLARGLARRGAKVVLLNRSVAKVEKLAKVIQKAGGNALALQANVLNRAELQAAAEQLYKKWGRVDALVNGAGGNVRTATVSPELSFLDLPEDALRGVIDLNLLGTVLPTQVFAARMVERKAGIIINFSSMNSFRPLTRIVGYSAAKAAVNNFTQWLAVHMARTYSPGIRVNAIAPGFFETAQNRFLLREEPSGDLTERGRQIIAHTPMNRFGEPDDLLGTLLWLISPASRFVTGIVVPVDGGFSAYSGV